MKNRFEGLNLFDPVHLLAVGFGSGLIYPAPGTWGSLAGLLLGVILLQYLSLPLFALFTLLAFIAGCYFCGKTAEDMGVHDHSSIVWDEFVGIFLVLLALPRLSWGWCLLAFLAFRLFDIIKPYPIGYFDQKLQTGFGIMLDDVLAAFYAILVIFLLRILF